MIQHSDFELATGLSQTRWRSHRGSNRLDCETGVLLRSLLGPVFHKATSWANLRRRLLRKGFDIGFFKGRLVLTDQDTGERICSCKFLGHPLKSLTSRLGRVRAQAPVDGRGYGALII